GPPVATRDVDKTLGFKQWDVTSIVRGWFTDPSTNFGLLLNSDPSKLRDRYRTFSSSEDPIVNQRPTLTVVYNRAGPPPLPPPPRSEERRAEKDWTTHWPQKAARATHHLYTRTEAKQHTRKQIT